MSDTDTAHEDQEHEPIATQQSPELAAALGEHAKYQGELVLELRLAIPDVSGSLNDGLGIDPFLLLGGERGIAIIDLRGDKFSYEPFIDPKLKQTRGERKGRGGPWTIIQSAAADGAMLVRSSSDLGKTLRREHRAQVQAVKDAENGTPALDFDDAEALADKEERLAKAEAEA